MDIDFDLELEELRKEAAARKEVLSKISYEVADDVVLTKKQKYVLDSIVRMIPDFDYYGQYDGSYEVKVFRVSQLGELSGSVDVELVTGLKNDEGTLAMALCRKYRHFFIGIRGGITTTIEDGKHLYPFKRVNSSVLMNHCYTH